MCFCMGSNPHYASSDQCGAAPSTAASNVFTNCATETAPKKVVQIALIKPTKHCRRPTSLPIALPRKHCSVQRLYQKPCSVQRLYQLYKCKILLTGPLNPNAKNRIFSHISLCIKPVYRWIRVGAFFLAQYFGHLG